MFSKLKELLGFSASSSSVLPDEELLDEHSLEKLVAVKKDFDTYLWAYKNDDTVRACIDIIIESAISPGFSIQASEEVREALNDFIRKNRLFSQLRDWILPHLLIFGNAFIVKVQKDNDMLIKPVDPRTMAVYRNNVTGEVVKYVQEAYVKYWELGQGDVEDERFTLKRFEFSPDEVVHIKLNSRGSPLGESVLAPVLDYVYYKKEIERILPIVSKRYGPQLVVTIGDETVNITNLPKSKQEKIVQEVAEKLYEIREDTDWVFPYPIDVKLLGAGGKTIDYVQYLRYFEDRIRTGLKVPSVFFEDTGRSGAGVQMRIFVLWIRSLQRLISESLREIFDAVLELNGLEGEEYSIVWGELESVDKTKAATRLKIYADAGILPTDVLQKLAAKIEGIDIEQHTLEYEEHGRNPFFRFSSEEKELARKIRAILQRMKRKSIEIAEESVRDNPLKHRSVDFSEEEQEIARFLDDFTIRAYYTGFDRGAKDINQFLGYDQEAIDFLRENNTLIAKRLSREIAEAVNREIMEAIMRRESVEQARERVRRVFTREKWRAETIARTELIRAATEGRLRAYRKGGLKKVNWVVAPDERTCPVCLANAAENPWPIEKAMGKIPAHPNCRCTFVPVEWDVSPPEVTFV